MCVLKCCIDLLTILFLDLCYTPESIPGDCRSIYDCPSVLAQFQGPLSPRTANYLRSLQCENGNGQYPYVCCVVFNNFERQSNRPSTRLTSSNGPRNNGNGRVTSRGRGNGQNLPGPGTCGLTSLAQRIYGGDDTQLDDYPWMALLEYQSRKYFCAHIVTLNMFNVQRSALSVESVECGQIHLEKLHSSQVIM